jgi:hypothetical protein
LKRIGEWTIEIIKRSDMAQGLRSSATQMASSNVLSQVVVAGWQRISKRQSPAPLLGRSLRTSEPSRGDSQELEIKYKSL